MKREDIKRANEIISLMNDRELFLENLNSDQLTIGIYEKDAPSFRIQLIGVPDTYEHPFQPLAKKFIDNIIEKTKADLTQLEYELNQL